MNHNTGPRTRQGILTTYQEEVNAAFNQLPSRNMSRNLNDYELRLSSMLRNTTMTERTTGDQERGAIREDRSLEAPTPSSALPAKMDNSNEPEKRTVPKYSASKTSTTSTQELLTSRWLEIRQRMKELSRPQRWEFLTGTSASRMTAVDPMLKAWTRIDVDKEDSLCTVSTSHKDNSASARGLTPAASSRPSTSTSTSQSSSARQTLPSPLPRRQPVPSCNTCLNPIRGSLPIKPNCSHTFCDPCAREHFTRATTNESLYPPSCCGKPIPFVRVFHCLTSSERTRFRRAQLEFASTDRTYCSNLCCGVFIQSGKELAVCPFCKSRSCGHCKRAEHPDIDCPEDTQLQKVLRLAERKGWKRCPRCRTMVEMRSGCYHITCVCGANWCFVCMRKWKTCACENWDEERLIERPE